MASKVRTRFLWWLIGVGSVAGASWVTSVLTAPSDVRSSLPSRIAVTDEIVSEVLSVTVRVPGSLVPADIRGVARPPSETPVVSALPFSTGETVHQGDVIVEIAGQPVFLLGGAIPPWRDIVGGIVPGRDVLQLEESLSAIGLLNEDPDRVLGDSTLAAIQALGASQGYDGVDGLGRWQVVFVAGGIGLFEAPSVELGDELADGLITVLSPERRVQVNLAAAAIDELRPGKKVILRDSSGEDLLRATLKDATLDPTTLLGQLLTVYLDLEEEISLELPESVLVEIVLETTQNPVYSASQAAVFIDEDGPYVVMEENGSEFQVRVSVTFVGDNRVQIQSEDPRIRDGTELLLNPLQR